MVINKSNNVYISSGNYYLRFALQKRDTRKATSRREPICNSNHVNFLDSVQRVECHEYLGRGGEYIGGIYRKIS